MGGTVSVTIRMKNGHEWRTRRWTNPLTGFFKHERFFTDIEAHIGDYMAEWMSMKFDWETNKDTRKYFHDMTSVYAPYPAPLAPYGYGLVVLDLKENQILSMQGYSSPDDVFATLSDFETEYPDTTYGKDLRKLVRMGKLRHTQNDTLWTEPELDAHIKNMERLYKAKVEAKEFEEEFFLAKVVFDPMKFTRYPETPEGSRKLRDRLIETGFVLSKQDQQAWAAWDRNRQE